MAGTACEKTEAAINACVSMGESKDSVVILGFGAAAVNALFSLRESGYAGAVTVVNNTSGAPYSPVLTSYYAASLIPKEQCYPWSAQELSELDFTLVENADIVSLDTRAHRVLLADGSAIPYSKCLIATGANPVAPGFPPTAQYAPLSLRTMDDAERLKAILEDDSTCNVLICGTSMVALKALEACVLRGKRVTLLGRSSQILRGSAHPAIAQRCESLLEDLGVILRLNDTVTCADDSCKSGIDITFSSDGSKHHYDQVILAQGVAPNIGFANPDEIDVDRGIVVDGLMRTSCPDVYAAGDVAQALDLTTSESKVIGLWANAVSQGKTAGRAIAASLCEETGPAKQTGAPGPFACATAGQARIPGPFARQSGTARPYKGSIPCNTIHVASILFASAGSVAEDEGVRMEIEERGSACKLSAYRSTGSGEEELVGFNLLASIDGPVPEDSLLNEAGLMHREIMGRYL